MKRPPSPGRAGRTNVSDRQALQERSRLRLPEERTAPVRTGGSMDEPHKHRDDSPRDHDAGDPPPGTPALDDERSGNFQQNVADEKDSRAQTKHPVAESQIMRHFECRVGDVYAVQESNDVEQPEEGQQTKRDPAPRALLHSQR